MFTELQVGKQTVITDSVVAVNQAKYFVFFGVLKYPIIYFLHILPYLASNIAIEPPKDIFWIFLVVDFLTLVLLYVLIQKDYKKTGIDYDEDVDKQVHKAILKERKAARDANQKQNQESSKMDASVRKQLHNHLRRGKSIKTLTSRNTSRRNHNVKVIPKRPEPNSKSNRSTSVAKKIVNTYTKTVSDQVERVRLILLMTIKTPIKLNEVMKRLDENDNGLLSMNEFLVLVKRIAKASKSLESNLPQEVLDATWQAVVLCSGLDTDGDGEVTIKDEINHGSVENW